MDVKKIDDGTGKTIDVLEQKNYSNKQLKNKNLFDIVAVKQKNVSEQEIPFKTKEKKT
jgi:hypothetical protein